MQDSQLTCVTKGVNKDGCDCAPTCQAVSRHPCFVLVVPTRCSHQDLPTRCSHQDQLWLWKQQNRKALVTGRHHNKLEKRQASPTGLCKADESKQLLRPCRL
eukprot:2573710-Amphidinium_carterae.2